MKRAWKNIDYDNCLLGKTFSLELDYQASRTPSTRFVTYEVSHRHASFSVSAFAYLTHQGRHTEMNHSSFEYFYGE